MKRSLVLVATLVSLAAAVVVHHARTSAHRADAHADARFARYANAPAPARDSVTEAEALRITERLYRYQADIMAASMRGEDAWAAARIDEAMAELDSLVTRPGLADTPRFRAAYWALTAEYEARYGVPDTLDLPTGEIYALRRDLFQALDRPAPQIEDVPESNDLRLTNTDVPMTVNRRVRQAIAFLVRRPHLRVYPWLRRSATYFPMIEQIFAEENVPDELKYLALIESGLNPHAHSRAHAAGLWQFIAPTARAYGLTIDPWVDERRDPEKATRAAARHLRDLYAMFGDWHLALAGYNCNPRLVRHLVARAERRLNRPATFWDIYDGLPAETRGYVPTYIAAAVVISNPAAFDLDRVAPGPRYAFDHVPVQGPHRLGQLAQLADVSADRLRALNPELRSDRLPPADQPYYVRLPYGAYTTFAQNYAALPEAARQQRLTHTVRPGETVGQIAQRYQVERPRLLRLNAPDPDRPPRAARRAEPLRLIVPNVHYAGNARLIEAVGGPKPIRVRYNSRATRPIAEIHPDGRRGAPTQARATTDLASSAF